MWKKQFRSRQCLEYKKKYKCPYCEGYTLYAFHDYDCECENGCDTGNINVSEIIQNQDYKGYFTESEIEENFYIDDELFNKMFKECLTDNTLHLVKKNEKDDLSNFLDRSRVIDKRLDDAVIKNMRDNNVDDFAEVTPFGYLINVIEDMHYFANLCVKDLVLFNYGIEFSKYQFYSGRFFYNNAIQHLFLVSERSYVLLGIIYGFEFSANLEENKVFKIEKFLKKTPKYMESNYKKIVMKLKGNNLYRELNDIRKSNDHDLSFFSKVIKNDIQENGNKNAERWDRDGDEVDKEFYLPLIVNVIFCLNRYYEFIEEIVNSLNDDQHEVNEVPMLRHFLNSYQNVEMKHYHWKEFENLNYKKDFLFLNLRSGKNMMFSDVFFRIAENLHCIADIFNLGGDKFYSYWRDRVNIELEGLIDEQYLLYSSMFRIYSCYDKISRMIASTQSVDFEVKYFADFEKVESDNPLIRTVTSIACSEEYTLLHRIRNDVYHNLRIGCLHGEKGLDWANGVILKIVMENIKHLLEITELYLQIQNKKVGRNELCPCGSGKKFKKCCLV